MVLRAAALQSSTCTDNDDDNDKLVEPCHLAQPQMVTKFTAYVQNAGETSMTTMCIQEDSMLHTAATLQRSSEGGCCSPGVLLDCLNGDPLLVIHHKDAVQQVHTLLGQLLYCLLDVRNL